MAGGRDWRAQLARLSLAQHLEVCLQQVLRPFAAGVFVVVALHCIQRRLNSALSIHTFTVIQLWHVV